MRFPEASESETQRIARGLRQKDAEVIGELVNQYQYRLVRYLLYLTGRSDRVEDMVQETWIRVLARAAQYEGRSKFETWLFSIARNLFVDGLRKRQVLSLDDPPGPMSEGSTSGSLPARTEYSCPFFATAKGEDGVRLAAALHLLDPMYREVLLLRFQEDLSLREIAGVTGFPLATVSSRIRRGLALLRLGLKGDINAV
jgi:RNA polymerase sigma-70 factor (ECF subfamily)